MNLCLVYWVLRMVYLVFGMVVTVLTNMSHDAKFRIFLNILTLKATLVERKQMRHNYIGQPKSILEQYW